jgi:hypothetical protein
MFPSIRVNGRKGWENCGPLSHPAEEQKSVHWTIEIRPVDTRQPLCHFF